MVTRLAAERTLSLAALQRKFGRTRSLSLLILSALLVMCLAFSWITRDAMAHLRFLKSQESQSGSQNAIVDQHPWQIAQALAPLAVTSEEVELAHEAERLADHDVNQAFASALRQANAQHTTPSGEALELTKTVARLQQMAKEDQARVKSMTQAANGAGDNDELKIAQAQLDLEEDELNDAQHDLARASGDVRTNIQQELAAHQSAVSKRNTATAGDSQLAVISTRQYGTLAGRLQAWFSQRSRYQLIQQAMRQAEADTATLTMQHNALERQANARTATAQVLPLSNATVTATADRLANLQQRRDQRQLLSMYDDRIQTQQQLEGVYSKWGSQVELQHRIVMHMAVRSLASIAVILIFVILCEAAGAALLERQALDRRRMQTLRTILRLTVQMAGILAVLLVTFGVPKEISTIVGLATAGLTVALQSFILAFVGWFILMGRNGMRVGDWVEINGVAGEVTAIDLFRTTILETSNWAAKGHPTGRRATFMNNFAVSGQFFNFSTVGQWMWDEVSVSIPATPEVYEKVAQISSVILELTGQTAELAEQEWKRIPRPNALSYANAGSSVNMRPAGAGIEVLIRYVTRAADRLEMRNRIYEQVLALLHKPQQVVRTSQPSALTAAVLAAKDPSEREVKEKRHSMYT